MKLNRDEVKELNTQGKILVSDGRLFAFNQLKSSFVESEIIGEEIDEVNRWWYPTFYFEKKEVEYDE